VDPQPLEDRPDDHPPAPANPIGDTSFSSSSLLHFGQAGLRLPTTRASKRWPHFTHAYSY